MPKTNDKPNSRQLIKPPPGSDTEDKSSKVPAVGDRFVGKRGDWVVTHAEASPGKIRIENQETYDIVFLNLESGLWKAIFFDEDDKRIKASNKSYEKLIRFVISNYDRELLKFEVSNTGMVQGYLTPFAFAGHVDKKKNKGKYRKGSNYIGTDIKENRGIDMKLNENFIRKLVRKLVKEEFYLSESLRPDIGNDVSYEVDQIMGERKISGWWCDFLEKEGALIWYNEKYGDRKKPGKHRRYYSWEVHSSPFFEDKPQFDMYIHTPNSNEYVLLAKKAVQPSGNDKADAKEYIKWFKSNISKVEDYINKKSSIKTESLNENANYHYEGDDLYVDSGFLNSAARNALPGFELKHMGFGEFYLAGPGGAEVQFDRGRGKDFPGKSGRSHLVYDNRGGKIISQMMDNVKKKKLANEA